MATKTKKTARITRSNSAKLDAAKAKSQPAPTIDEIGKAAQKAVVRLGNDPRLEDYPIRDLVNLVTNAMQTLADHPECSDSLSAKVSSLASEAEDWVTERGARSNGVELVAKKAAKAPESGLVTDAEAEQIARDIFTVTHTATDEADVVGHAVMRIIRILADESDKQNRWSNGITLNTAIYRRTRNCCDSMDRFAEGSRPKVEVEDLNPA